MKCPVSHWARSTPSRPALTFEGRTWSYRELDQEVRRWTQTLAANGVRRGARVALLSTNRAELVALFHACGRLGAISAPLNVRLTREEVRPLLARLAPALVIAEERWATGLENVKLLEKLQPSDEPVSSGTGADPKLEPSATFAVLFTSGTTGTPRAAELTVSNFAASADASGKNLGNALDQRWLACLPLFHVGGLAMLTRCAWYGACLVVHGRFDEEAVNDALDRQEATHLSLVESTLARLLAARGNRPFPRSVRAALIGGGPVSSEILQSAKAVHLPVLQTYGLTEATSQVTTERVGDANGRTAGPPLAGVEVRIADPGGKSLPHGETGEIQVRGPTVMRGYFGDERATAEVFSDGWLKTGDVGSLDGEGRLTVLARRTDLIISGGENIYPAEVEQVLKRHPFVQEAAVSGMASERWGSVPVAVVVARKPAPSEQDLEAWCRGRLAGFKIPKRFVFLDALPTNEMGKVDRGALARLVNK